jgi:hypothetical protein
MKESSINFYTLVQTIKDIFKPFPEAVQINPNFQDTAGNTAAMYFVKHRKLIPPLCLQHDPNIYNKKNKNIAMLTIEHCIGLAKLPDWMMPNNRYAEDKIGETLAIKWVRHHREEPPINIRIDPNFKTRQGQQVLAVRWIVMTGKEVPIWMRCFPELEDGLLGTMANAWITSKYGKIPKYMKYSKEFISKGRTLAMKWIQHNGVEPPRWLRHSPNLVAGGETMASIWFNIHQSDVPNYMRHAPDLEVGGTTLAMRWIQTCKTEPPAWMRHSSILEKAGNTMATTWISTIKTEPPGWMKYSPELLIGGYTMAMKYVIFLQAEPPQSLRHEPHISSKDGLSLKTYWQRYCAHTALPEWMKFKPYMKGVIGCSHPGDKLLNSSNELVCSDCGIGEKTFCYEMCPICREGFEKGVEIIIFRSCKHVFCGGCLEMWNKTHPEKCPCCNNG